MPESRNSTKQIYCVGGGKGGVGKSIFSVALSASLARRGRRVVVVDLDLGAANLHSYLGIMQRTPSLAEFMLREVMQLDNLLIETPVAGLQLIRGAEFVPGAANPAHWMKLKIMRHIKALPADIVVIDLGAGMSFNTLDFFGLADHGIVLTAAEPAAIMNAYGFVKSALFRGLQRVFRNHPPIRALIDEQSRRAEGEGGITLEWLSQQIQNQAPELLPLLAEIRQDFHPALIGNRIAAREHPPLLGNLLSLCRDRLGVGIQHLGNLPDVPDIGRYLLCIPHLLRSAAGLDYARAVQDIADQLYQPAGPAAVGADFSDAQIQQVHQLIDSLELAQLAGENREVWKLRMYFKPAQVVQFLLDRGVKHPVLFAQPPPEGR